MKFKLSLLISMFLTFQVSASVCGNIEGLSSNGTKTAVIIDSVREGDGVYEFFLFSKNDPEGITAGALSRAYADKRVVCVGSRGGYDDGITIYSEGKMPTILSF